MNLDEIIEKLNQLRDQSPLKGDTVVHICIQNHPYQQITEVKGQFEQSDNSGVILFFSDGLDEIIEDYEINTPDPNDTYKYFT